jgi:aspartate aminotransferase-like enzyme
MRAINLQLLCEEKASASTLTVVKYPEAVRDADLRKTLADKYGITIAGGLGPLNQKVFRVGHMGNVNRNDLLATIAAIEGGLTQQGYDFPAGAGIATANRVLNSGRIH